MNEGNLFLGASAVKKERDYFIDNLKVALILTVVVGHFCKKMKWVPGFTELMNVVYMFHMPCFVFVSGYLANNLYRNGRFRSEKVLSILWTYVLYKIVLYILRFELTGKRSIRWFWEKESPWYLLSLLAWYVMVPLLKSFKPVALIPFTVFLGVIAGYVNALGLRFSSSRMIVFLPFFCLGLCMSGIKLGNLFRDWRMRLLGGVLFVVCVVGLVCFMTELNPLIKLFSGAFSYSRLKFSPVLIGGFWRLLWYFVAAASSFFFMQLIPRRRLWISAAGSRTLQIYMGHVLVRNACSFTGVLQLTKQFSTVTNWILLWGGSILLVIILGNPLLAKVLGVLTNPPIFKKMLR